MRIPVVLNTYNAVEGAAQVVVLGVENIRSIAQAVNQVDPTFKVFVTDEGNTIYTVTDTMDDTIENIRSAIGRFGGYTIQ